MDSIKLSLILFAYRLGLVMGNRMRKPSQRKDFINYLLTTQAKNVQLKHISAYLTR